MKVFPGKISIALLTGFFSGFILTLFFFALFVSSNFFLQFSDVKSYFLSIKSATDANILQILLSGVAFSLIGILNLKKIGRRQSRLRTFFTNLILFSVILFFASYMLYALNDTAEEIFNSKLRFSIFLILSVILSVSFFPFFKNMFFFIYVFLLRVFMIPDPNEYVPNGVAVYSNKKVPSYEVFLQELEDGISIAKRNRSAIGIIGFKISNHPELLENYSSEAYHYLQKQLITVVKKTARSGEDQCLEQEGAIYSLLYADSEGAKHALERYREAVSSHIFMYKDVEIDVKVSSGVAGIDFEKSEEVRIESELRDVLMWKILDVLAVDEENLDASIKYD